MLTKSRDNGMRGSYSISFNETINEKEAKQKSKVKVFNEDRIERRKITKVTNKRTNQKNLI